MRTILVTGANSGVGFALTEALAARGCAVVMAVRDRGRGERARDEVLRVRPGAALSVEEVDLTDLASVRALAARVETIDVLVNNAGIAFEPRRVTRDGVVAQFAANHLGHFALTAALLERLTGRPDARVVTVTSTLAKRGTVDLDNLDGSRGYTSARAYAQSKLANVWFGAELDRRARAGDWAVKSVLAHPGVPATAMQQKAHGVMAVVARTASALLGQPPAHGAMAVLEAALGPSVAGGDLWEPGRRVGDPPRRATPWPSMADRDGAAALWARSEAFLR